jgi:hypothetical protein
MTATMPGTQTIGHPGEEPVPTGLGLVHEEGRSLRGTWRGGELFRYVYRPWDPQLESPRPYFHPLRTLGGDLVSLYRPWDHVWHKGIAWSLSNVGTENFWGGVTYTREHGYRQLSNNGGMWHDDFDLIGVPDGVLRFDERLTWVAERGQAWIEERRRVGVAVLPDYGAWQLTFETTMHNLSGAAIPIGSPTTEGRDNAGYSGLFWRGPRSFSGGRVVMPDREGGDELMGARGPWLAFVGRHDGNGRSSSLLFCDSATNLDHPNQWFVRSGMYACVCPAPFFSQEYRLADGESLVLRYDIVIADGALDGTTCARLAAQAGALDLGPPA